MQTPNENGVYMAEIREEVARHGRAYAAIDFCQCEDGLYRYALRIEWSYGGSGGPIFDSTPGYASLGVARDAALQAFLTRWPRAWASEPQSVHAELLAMKMQLQGRLAQPSLF